MNKTAFKCIIIIFSTLILLSCEVNQDKLFNKLQSEFNDSIKKYNAKKYDYQFDGLSPQTSYFVDCKLRYLELKTNGELTSIHQLVIFENDSITKIIERVEMYEGNNNGNEAGRNWDKIESDSIYITDFKKNKKDYFVNNKLVKTHNELKIREEFNFIYKVKEFTEKNYNSK